MADEILNLQIRVNSETGALEVVSDKLKNVGKAAKETDESFLKLSKVTKELLSIFGVGFGMKTVTDFFKSTVVEAEKEIQVFRRISFSLEALGISFSENEKAIADWGNTVTDSTKFTDNEAYNALDKFLKVVKTIPEAMTLSSTAMGMSANSGMDLSQAQQILTDLVRGSTRGVMMANKEFANLVDINGSNKDALDKLIERFYSAAKNEDTLTTNTQKLSKEFGNLKEAIGKDAIPQLIEFERILVRVLDQLKKPVVAEASNTLVQGMARATRAMMTFGTSELPEGIRKQISILDKLAEAYHGIAKAKDDADKKLGEPPVKPPVQPGPKDDEEQAKKLRLKQKNEEAERKVEEEIDKERRKAINNGLKADKDIARQQLQLSKGETAGKLADLDEWREEQEKAGADVVALNKLYAEKRTKIQSDSAKEGLDITTENTKYLAEQGHIGKEMYKEMATAQTIIATIEGAQKVFSSFAALPFGTGITLGVAAAAIVTAAGMARAAQIQAMAKGGVVEGSQGGIFANIGEQGRDEAVLPLEDAGAMQKIGKAIGSQMEGGAGGGSQTINVSVNLAVDKLTIDNGKAIINALAREIAQRTADAVRVSVQMKNLADKNATKAV